MIAGISDSNWDLISLRTLAMGADSQVVSREYFHIFTVCVLCEFSSRRSKSLTMESCGDGGGEGEWLRLCVFLVVSKLCLVRVAVVRPRWHSVFVRSASFTSSFVELDAVGLEQKVQFLVVKFRVISTHIPSYSQSRRN